MNSALLLSIATALAILQSSQFSQPSHAPATAKRTPHYLQLQRTPQLAVLSDQQIDVRQDASRRQHTLPAGSYETLAF